MGTRKFYFSHLHLTVKEVTPAAMARTRFFGRWREASKLMLMPWEERIKQLPRYVPPPEFEPGTRRLAPQLVHDEAAAESAARAGSRAAHRKPRFKLWTGSGSKRPSRK